MNTTYEICGDMVKKERLSERDVRGSLDPLLGLSLSGLLQVLYHEGKTCTLKLVHSKGKGRLHMKAGSLVGASTDTLQGEAAAIDIMSWSAPMIELGPLEEGAELNITKPMHSLLMDSARRQEGRDPTRYATKPALIYSGDEKTTQVTSPNPGPGPDSPSSYSSSKENILMANVKDSLAAALQIDGAFAVALVDFKSGMCLGQAGSSLNLDVAAAGNTEVVRAELKTMANLGIKDTIEDILITLGSQYHIIRPLTAATASNLFFYLVLDKAKASLAMARHQIAQIEGSLQI